MFRMFWILTLTLGFLRGICRKGILWYDSKNNLQDSQFIALFVTVLDSRRRNSAEKISQTIIRVLEDTLMNISQVSNEDHNQSRIKGRLTRCKEDFLLSSLSL